MLAGGGSSRCLAGFGVLSRCVAVGVRVRIHRVGALAPSDQIVLVGVTSAHRGEAFAACEFIIDYLKTQAPFWKKEQTSEGARWVEARAADDDAAARWQAPGEPDA